MLAEEQQHRNGGNRSNVIAKTRSSDRSVPAPLQRIDTPATTTGSGQIKHDEAIEDRKLPAVQNGIEALWRMNHEIGNGHLSREQESHWSGEQPQKDKGATNQFQNRGGTKQARDRDWPRRSTRRKAEELDEAMRQK
jgi:hypothetical protein